MSTQPPPGPPPPPPPGWQPPPPPGPPPPPPPGWQPRPSASDDTTWAVLCHLSFFVLGIIAPLIIMLTKGTQSAYVRDQAVEALNFHITFAIGIVLAIVSLIVLIGFVLVPVVAIAGVVLAILATVAASRGELYRYPVNLRLVR